MQPRMEEVAGSIGRVVFDEYGREIGILVSVNSNAEGLVDYVEVKVEDVKLETVEGDRLRIADGKVLVIPDWKYAALKLVESLDRSYKRKKGLEEMIAKGALPPEILTDIDRGLSEEIKKLKMKAKEVESEIKKRIEKIDTQYVHVARAMAVLQMTYFSGEVGERQFEQGMSHLKKLRDTLTKEKEEAKEMLDRLSKTIELATSGKTPEKAAESKPQEAVQPPKQPEALTVKVVEG